MAWVPFEHLEPAMKMLRKGQSIQVRMLDNSTDHMIQQRLSHYGSMLGFDDKQEYRYCYILSEIGNCSSHYIVLGNNGKIVPMLHGEFFLVDDEEF